LRERRKKGIRSPGRSRAGQTTKFHLALSPSGVVSWHIGPGNEPDNVALQKLWSFRDWSRVFAVIADTAYDSNAIRALIAFCGARAVIPPNPRRVDPIPECDEILYDTRKKIEQAFGYQKENKRVYSRFDKLDCAFAAFHACAFIKRILC
jgi:transposase